MTTTTYTHTPHGSHHGNAICVRCHAGITHIYTAHNTTTGAIETFGSDCHFQVTGVDTRQAQTVQRSAARVTRNTTRIPTADLDIHARLTPIVETIWGDYLTGVTGAESYLLCTTRNWVRDWTPGTRTLTDWLDEILRDTEIDRGIAARFAAAAGINLERVTGKAMTSRFGGTCATCSARIRKGDPIIYNGAAHCAAHGGE